MLQRLGRILLVTLALSVIGAIVGAISGAVLVSIAEVLDFGLSSLRSNMIAQEVAASVGAVLGAVLAPASAWILMRHVAIWRAIAETTLGTCAGALIGMLFGTFGDGPPVWGFFGALLGFVVAAVWLRIRVKPNAVHT